MPTTVVSCTRPSYTVFHCCWWLPLFKKPAAKNNALTDNSDDRTAVRSTQINKQNKNWNISRITWLSWEGSKQCTSHNGILLHLATICYILVFCSPSGAASVTSADEELICQTVILHHSCIYLQLYAVSHTCHKDSFDPWSKLTTTEGRYAVSM